MSRIKTAERIFISLLFAGALFIAAESRGEEQSHEASLSVKADTDRNRDKKQTVEQKGNNTVTTVIDEEAETCSLEIEVENSSNQSDSYQLEWYFIAKRISAKGDEALVIFDSGKMPITLDAGASAVKKAVSKPFIFTIKDVDGVNSTGFRTGPGTSRQIRGGDEYAGYIVLVRAAGEILQKDSNSSRFLNDEWLAQCDKFSKITPVAKKKKK